MVIIRSFGIAETTSFFRIAVPSFYRLSRQSVANPFPPCHLWQGDRSMVLLAKPYGLFYFPYCASHSEEVPAFLPDRFEPGTPNIPGILGLHAALCDLEKQSMEEIRQHELMLTQYFIDGILNLDPEEKFLRIIGKKNIENRCAVVSVQTLHMDMAQAAFELDITYGIMTRVGLHCAPNAHKTLGTYPEGTLRFSFGPENRKQELDIALDALSALL